ncbi:hypothetical protein [Devosia sp.]|uniref:hypothetical protein n=1 Tax=Devosia sp. TaxID=1871048 RepID=UPI002AFF2F7D|nr:hypothetical protein [Devosia sp.]
MFRKVTLIALAFLFAGPAAAMDGVYACESGVPSGPGTGGVLLGILELVGAEYNYHDLMASGSGAGTLTSAGDGYTVTGPLADTLGVALLRFNDDGEKPTISLYPNSAPDRVGATCLLGNS